eukprot:CAMPEP_0171748260 /NCGR_PEP_ID=MMETSP0991-20121206/39987_1 /TAXON_ID=483369 /ORGANISM="non described non described, Strain CCMP2098" /LENGTH=33 /DNA_ID= /DNA_START= /DNA_END= /DNA_ORIENTATION=
MAKKKTKKKMTKKKKKMQRLTEELEGWFVVAVA